MGHAQTYKNMYNHRIWKNKFGHGRPIKHFTTGNETRCMYFYILYIFKSRYEAPKSNSIHYVATQVYTFISLSSGIKDLSVVPVQWKDPRQLSWYSHGLRAGRPGFDYRQGQGVLPFSTMSSSALGPTQPPIQWELASISPGVKQPGVKLATYLHLVPISRMVELYLHSTICLHGIMRLSQKY
jgi:hypothetical protein